MSETQAFYGVTLIAQAPAATLESVHAALLPHVLALGFHTLTLDHGFTGTYHGYSAACHVAGQDRPTMLAYSFQCHSLEELQAAATESLHALTELPCASL